MLYYDLNERLEIAVNQSNFEDTLSCILDGANAVYVSPIYGRTAVGTAAFLGNAEILELLIQSCEEPELELFRQTRAAELDMDTTPDDMDKLEWEDEFNAGNSEPEEMDSNATEEEDTSLYFYYAKTFEQTGELIANMTAHDCYSACGSSGGIYPAPQPQDPHTKDSLLMSPLHYAAAHGNVMCVRVLLQHGAPIDDFNSEGKTPLHLGVKYVEVTRVLIKHGANVNLKTINGGWSAIHLAAQRGHVEVANIILQTNANINQTDDQDRTPLISAMAYDCEEIALALIERGARVNLQDTEGDTALYYAVIHNRLKLAALLLDRGARLITSDYLLHFCVQHDQLRMAELLLLHGEHSLAVHNDDGYTPIMLAIGCGKPALLDYLLQVATADQQKRHLTEYMDNELLEAIQRYDNVLDFQPIARVLLTHSERTRRDLYDNTGQQPIVCAVPYCQTPLSRAITQQKFDIAAWLIREGCGIKQICREHVVYALRSNPSKASRALAQLLVNAGFHFPCTRVLQPKSRTPDRLIFEHNVSVLMSEPLRLQSLARLVVRGQLTTQLATVPQLQRKYLASAAQSSMAQIIETLELPDVLKSYLCNFDDCPVVGKDLRSY